MQHEQSGSASIKKTKIIPSKSLPNHSSFNIFDKLSSHHFSIASELRASQITLDACAENALRDL